ncbi:C-Jun-amino-terminal kinase-interacting protein 1 [Nematostella vectensis]|uniref:C-Jun-amino-terminal kinase-interacting protein 1 n=1 Tax=Nematostella vectensis TaxID=45351 RepID=UPI00207761AC|nr:C-Jun-amino-terminal kinase-interacting protein 1 [Nematostella vectensis]
MLNSNGAAATPKSTRRRQSQEQQDYTSGYPNNEEYREDLGQITHGINTLVHDIYNEPDDLESVGLFPASEQEVRHHGSRQANNSNQRIVSYSHSPGILRRCRLPFSRGNGTVAMSKQPVNRDPRKNIPKNHNSQVQSEMKNYRCQRGGDPNSDGVSDISACSSGSHSSTDESGLSPTGQLKQTHVATHKFIMRHNDEINLDEGDPMMVYQTCEDLWCEGTNLRTGQCGVFPSRYVASILNSQRKRQDSFSTFSTSSSSNHNQFHLRFLGSVEVKYYKGNDVLCTAMKEIVKQRRLSVTQSSPPFCTVEVSVKGISVVQHGTEGAEEAQSPKKSASRTKLGKLFDKDQKGLSETKLFFFLKNVTFCGCHPNNTRYFAFITKHPEEPRFACHVFMSEFSTEPVAYSIGKAFKDFYADFLGHQSSSGDDFYVD